MRLSLAVSDRNKVPGVSAAAPPTPGSSEPGSTV